jgi:uncharacterized protein YfaS (alpha-2-macroglobulin family)
MPVLFGVALRDGEPVAGVDVRLIDDTGEPIAEVETGEDGTFELEIEPGTWTLRWASPEGDEDEGEIEIIEGEDAEVELEV